MTQQVANPIYDATFKYLMDDPRVAKTLIAAILKIKKTDILELTPDRNEIIVYKQDDLRNCRLDFTVRIKTDKGVKAIYIELQKAWSKGEMARFRSYLASQYTRASNVGNDNFPLPILSIYIVGENIENLDEPVTYITRHYYNQDGMETNKDCPSWFVECLSHDMVVIQVPKIKAKPDSTLDKILTIFDQTKKVPNNNQLINYNINDYGISDGDLFDDISFLVRRLERAFGSEEVRVQMCLEDQLYEIINGKQSAEEKVAEQEKQLAEQTAQLQQQTAQLQQQAAQLQQQATRIAKSIKKLHSQGESIEDIAADLDVGVDFVKKVLETE